MNLPVTLLVATAVAALSSLSLTPLDTADAVSSARVKREQELARFFKKQEIIELDMPIVARQVRTAKQLSLHTPSTAFDLELVPHDMRASSYHAQEVGPDGVVRVVEKGGVHTYKGRVRGMDKSHARFSVSGKSVEGVIMTDTERYYVEPAERYSASAKTDEFVFYKASDVVNDPEFKCGVTMGDKVNAAAERFAANGVALPNVFSPVRVVEMATEADYEYVAAHGGSTAANDEILSIMNIVEGIYEKELGITFQIVYQHTWATADDPYSPTAAPGQVLTEFRGYWNANMYRVARDFAYMWTGKNMGGYLGLTYLGALCNNPALAYGMSRKDDRTPLQYHTTAHEIGHILGASHPDAVPGCAGTIMGDTYVDNKVTILLTFCPFSRDEIMRFLTTNSGCLTNVPTPNGLQFAAPAYTVTEGLDRAAVITVTRSGDAQAAVSVDYQTSDAASFARCDERAGVASNRCDYATAADTLIFAPGERERTITVPITDDGWVEGDERLTLTLTNPINATLGTQNTTQLTITDNDTSNAVTNPIDSAAFFVRQQYVDFLSREPELEGFNAWLEVLNRCNGGFAGSDPSCDRVIVSQSFFQSEEFQAKGYFVYRFYRSTLGRRPTYAEMISDMRRVTGATGDEVLQKRSRFAREWLNRAEVKSLYDALNDAAFVDKLMRTNGLNAITVGGVTLSRDVLLDQLRFGEKSRAQIIREIVESQEVTEREFNGAFVAMQYYGYLRRDPEEQGYNAWLRYLNANPTDYRTMVSGFANSTEYRLRFAQP